MCVQNAALEAKNLSLRLDEKQSTVDLLEGALQASGLRATIAEQHADEAAVTVERAALQVRMADVEDGLAGLEAALCAAGAECEQVRAALASPGGRVMQSGLLSTSLALRW